MREVYLPSSESTNIAVTVRIKKIYLFMLIIDWYCLEFNNFNVTLNEL